MRFEPRKGDMVRVCYDGKAGRAVIGQVLARRGFAVEVEFEPFAEENTEPISCWFVRIHDEAFGGHLRKEDSLMSALGDWYSVLRITTK